MIRLLCPLIVLCSAAASAQSLPSDVHGPATTSSAAFPDGFRQTELRLEPDLPTGLPILCTLVVENSGHEPITLYHIGRGYPIDVSFGIDLKDERGQLAQFALLSSSYYNGPVRNIILKHGESFEFKTAFGPLAAGHYTGAVSYAQISIWMKDGGSLISPFAFDVKADAQTRANWERVRKRDLQAGKSFGAIVAVEHNIGTLREELCRMVQSEDLEESSKGAWLVAAAVNHSHAAMPPDIRQAVTAAERKVKALPINSPDGSPQANLQRCFAELIGETKDESLLPTLLDLSRSTNITVRARALEALTHFDRKDARDRLAEKLIIPAGGVLDIDTAYDLAGAGDLRAVAAILSNVQHEEQSGEANPIAYAILTMFPDVPGVRDCIEHGLKSDKPQVVEMTKMAVFPQPFAVDPLTRQPPPKWMTELRVDDAVAELLKADEFALLDETTASDPPRLAINIRRATDSKMAGNALQSHLRLAGTTAAKLYALCLAYQDGKDTLKRDADALIAAGGQIMFIDGKQRGLVDIAKIVPRIVSGELPARMFQLYPR